LVMGFRPRRTTPLANISGVTSGISDKSISASVMASRRLKSVPDFFKVAFFFILSCLSGRDDPEDVVFISVSHNDDAELQESKGDLAGFAIIKAFVLDCENITVKHSRHIGAAGEGRVALQS